MGQCKSSEAASEKSSPAEELSRPRRNSGLLMIESKESDTVASSTKSLRRFGYKNDGDRRHMEEKESFPNLNARVSIKSTLLKSGIFNDEVNKRGISPADIDNIVDAFKIEHFREGQFILEKDDFRCEKLFIVRQGVFKCLDGAKCKMVMKEKSILGELGFFHHNPPLLSICTSSVISSAYVLNKRDFKAIVEKGRNLQDIRILQSLSEAQKYRMKDKIQLTNFVRGEVILGRGAIIPYFYIVLSGQIAVADEGPLKSSSYLSRFPSPRSLSPRSSQAKRNSFSSKNSKGSEIDNSDFTLKYFQVESTFLNPGDYFGEERYVGKKKKSSKSFTAVNEVTVCLVTKELFNDVEFQPAKTFIIADILIKAEEIVVRGLRTRRSLIRFNSQDLECSSRTSVSVSQKSGMIRQGSGISRQGSVNSRQSSAFSRQGSSVRSFDGETKDNESTDTETNYFNNDGMRVSRDEVDDLPSMILCGLSIDVCGCSSGNSNGNGNGSGTGTGSLSFR